MAKVINHEALFSTDLKYFTAIQIIEGKTIFDRYNSLDNIIKNYIDAEYQNFISYPVKNGDLIEFHGRISKEVPQILSELDGELYSKYQEKKIDTLNHFKSKIEKLNSENKADEVKFLESAIKYVDDRFVYCYDDRVVLGLWGMTMRKNPRDNIYVIRKDLRKRPLRVEEPSSAPDIPTTNSFTMSFNQGDCGYLEGQTEFSKYENDIVSIDNVPNVVAYEGFEFIGWDIDPNNYLVNSDIVFTAQYEAIEQPSVPPPPIIPKISWWKRFWIWLTGLFTGKGCLKWLIWLLLAIVLVLLLSWLLRGCNARYPVGGGAIGDNDSSWLIDDPNRGHNGGIYDPYNPYQPVPTPPEFNDILPPYQGTLPPIEGDPDIIPGNPSIIGNRLNILMENEDKSIMDLARDFKTKYPEDKYKVVYYDDVVKRMQIEIPKEEREKLKNEIPSAFAPEYELFVFDESLFEGIYTPSDPDFADANKSWYLKAINAFDAWDITQGSGNISIAVVDNGFNLNHPELKDKVVQPYNVWLRSQKIFPQVVDHGTHVAGTALAFANNGKGLCGIAPNAKFIPVQVADKQGLMTITSVLDGILYALYQGADVVNISLGSQFDGFEQYSENDQQKLIENNFKEEERLWRRVSRIASKHKSTIVVSAGNSNILAGVEALQRPDNIIVVSATDKNNGLVKADFSNYGRFSDISAPGVEIYSSIGENDYTIMDGTSMAAPIVSGAVALMKSINDSLTSRQILCILQGTSLRTEGNIGGLIQLDKALKSVQSGEDYDCTPTPSTGDVQILLNWDNYNDLDLICTDPNGNSVWYKNPMVQSGGELEIDMNVEYPDSKTPVENIYWKPGTAPEGTYNVYLLYYKQHIETNETSYKINIKYGDKTETFIGEIKSDDDAKHICSFTLGDVNDNDQILAPLTPTPSPDDNSDDELRLKLEQERERLQRELDRVNSELRRFNNRR